LARVLENFVGLWQDVLGNDWPATVAVGGVGLTGLGLGVGQDIVGQNSPGSFRAAYKDGERFTRGAGQHHRRPSRQAHWLCRRPALARGLIFFRVFICTISFTPQPIPDALSCKNFIASRITKEKFRNSISVPSALNPNMKDIEMPGFDSDILSSWLCTCLKWCATISMSLNSIVSPQVLQIAYAYSGLLGGTINCVIYRNARQKSVPGGSMPTEVRKGWLDNGVDIVRKISQFRFSESVALQPDCNSRHFT
jgi:hypothetical protein